MQTADILRSVRERFDALPVPVKIGMAAGGSVLLIAVVIGLFASGPTAPTPAATTTAATAGPAAVVVPPVVVPPAGVAGGAPDAAAATAPVAAPTVVDVAPAAPRQILQLQRLRETWSVGTSAGDWKEVAAIERDAPTFLFSSEPTGDLEAMIRPSSGRFFKVEATGYFRVAVPGEHAVIVSHSASDGNAGLFIFLNDSTIPLAQSAVQVFGPRYARTADSLVTAVALTPGIHRLRVVARQDSVRGAPMEVRVLMRAPGDPVPVPVVPGILTDEIVTPAAPAAAPAAPATAAATPVAPVAPAAPAPSALEWMRDAAATPVAATATPVAPAPAAPAVVPGAPAAVAPIAAAATPVAPAAAPSPAPVAPAAPVPAPAAPVR